MLCATENLRAASSLTAGNHSPDVAAQVSEVRHNQLGLQQWKVMLVLAPYTPGSPALHAPLTVRQLLNTTPLNHNSSSCSCGQQGLTTS